MEASSSASEKRKLPRGQTDASSSDSDGFVSHAEVVAKDFAGQRSLSNVPILKNGLPQRSDISLLLFAIMVSNLPTMVNTSHALIAYDLLLWVRSSHHQSSCVHTSLS